VVRSFNFSHQIPAYVALLPLTVKRLILNHKSHNYTLSAAYKVVNDKNPNEQFVLKLMRLYSTNFTLLKTVNYSLISTVHGSKKNSAKEQSFL